MSKPNTTVRAVPSTLALKIIVALTGLGLAAWVLLHMIGHLPVVFGTRETYNAYAHNLQSLTAVLWGMRLGLLGLFSAHVIATVALVKRNRTARPESYAVNRSQRTTMPAKLMFEAGIVLILFLVYHLLHFTIGVVHAEPFDLIDPAGNRDLYTHVVWSFQQWPITLSYVIASTALALHLSHGVQSVFKTLGLAAGRWREPIELIGPAFGTLIWLGFIMPPLACLAGLVTLN